MRPVLSVVVPFYGVEQYLRECLDSLRAQTLRDLEVIMVDDGSPDGSAAIAKEFADRDPRFVLVQQENQGLGPARNTGAARARGTYLAFVDSDDVVARNCYELLVGSLEDSGSDIACGNVARFDAVRTYPSDMHRATFRTARRATHVTRDETLLMDRTAWNKVFRRSFWDAHSFAFPAGVYEDIPVTVPAHFLATSVDVLTDVVYYYRVRGDGDASITQRRAEIPNMETRVAVVRDTSAFLTRNAPAELARAYDRYALSSDLRPFLNTLARADEAYRDRFAELMAPYLATVDGTVLDELPAITRLEYHLLGRGLMAELLEVLDFEAGGTRDAGTVRQGRHWYARYPYFRSELDVPDRIYELRDELGLRARVDDVEWRNGRLRVTGHAYIDRMGTRHKWRSQIVVLLRRPGTKRVRPVRITRVLRPDVTAAANQRGRCYDWSGFTFELDPARLGLPRGAAASTWEIHVLVATRGVFRRGPLARPMPGRAEHPPYRDLPDGAGGRVRVQPTINARGHLVIRTERITAAITGYRIADDVLHLTGRLDDPSAAAPELTARLRRGMTAVRVPLTRTADEGGRGFTAEFPLARLFGADHTAAPAEAWPDPDDTDDAGAMQAALAVDPGVAWDVLVEPGGDAAPVPVTVTDGFAGTRHAAGGREIAVDRTRYGDLILVERVPHLVADRVAWTTDGRLELGGGCADPATRPSEIILDHHGRAPSRRFPLHWDGARFTAVLAPGDLEDFGQRHGIAVGTWDLRTEVAGQRRAVLIERNLVDDLGGRRRVRDQEMEVRTYRLDALRLVIRGAYTDERGAYAQHLLRRDTYPALRARPLRDAVVFESYFGTQYSCSPRAVYEEMRRRDLDLDFVWVSEGGLLRPPGPARTVLVGSREHYEALATSRYIVSNCGIQYWYVKREGQTYVQTWHGSPLKRIGFDIEAPTMERGRRRMEILGADALNWDLLVSQSAFTTPILRRALRYDGEVGEFGYPRNDELHRGGPEAVARRRARARERLGIPPGKRVVLYAPTWRDDQNPTRGVYGFDIPLDLGAARDALGEDYVLLLRMHHLITSAARITDTPFLRDVSAHPDINELFLASDVLVTDYSSAMFDFAGTGRPILLFTPDLERYRDTTRGLSFDFPAYAPGPLLGTSDELIAALGDLDGVAARYADAHARFRATFSALDDGNAAARVVDYLLSRGG